MKITFERTYFHILLFVCFPLLFLFMGTSCQKEPVDDLATKIIGTWHQTSQTKDDITIPKDSSRLLMQINDDHICILCDSSYAAVKAKTIIKRSGWSYTGGLFNLAIDLPATWTPVAESNSLTIQRIDFKPDGSLSKTRLSFERVATLEIK